jgi:predicted DNA-binding transcriptional regulator AlpA
VEYEFRFVVEGATVDDADIVDLLARDLDAMLFRGGGVNLLDVASEGTDAFTAALSIARTLRMTVPGLRLVRLHRDLVGVPEIADRLNVSRQNVHQWINGSRRGGNSTFPAAEGVAGRARVWLWTEVNSWLAHHGLDDGVNGPNREEMADIDSALNCGLYQRSPTSVERWRRTRTIGVTAAYTASLIPVLTEVDSQDSPQGWSEVQAVGSLAGAQ